MESFDASKAVGPTGPRTPEGKAVVALNAMKHGGYSEAIIVLGEDPDDYAAFHAGLSSSLNPVGPLEEEMVGRLAQLWWRLQRVGRAEREGLKSALERELWRRQLDQVANPVHLAFVLTMAAGDGRHTERLLRHEAQLERGCFRLLHELERVQAQRQGQVMMPQVVVDLQLTTG